MECSYCTKQALEHSAEISSKAIEKLEKFIKLIEEAGKTASKNTHYDKLDEWSDPIHDYISKTLRKFGFKNGNVEHNDKIPDVRFWWDIYGVISNICYSPFLNSITESHHSSAYERNCALEAELKYLIKEIRI